MPFYCLEYAHEAALLIGPLIHRIRKHDRSLAEQIRRAAACVPSNIDEGAGFDDGRRESHYRVALGSAREVATQLRIAIAWGYIDDATEVLDKLDRVRAMLWRLTH